MNKLEKYRDEKATFDNAPVTYDNFEATAWVGGYENGFNAAIELELPVKFAEWLNSDRVGGWYFVAEWDIWYTGDERYSHTKKNGKTTKELYQYWILNVYKLEQ